MPFMISIYLLPDFVKKLECIIDVLLSVVIVETLLNLLLNAAIVIH